MSEYIHKSHNVSVLLYHFVCPSKYRRIIFSKEVDKTLVSICFEISKRYDITFLEIGTDNDHVHFLVQSIPSYSPTKIVTLIKSILARELFKNHKEIKKELWGGSLWSSGYFVNTVSKFGDESRVSNYVKSQGLGKEYSLLHKEKQLSLF